MDIFLLYVLGVCFIGLVFCGIMSIRNGVVYRSILSIINDMGVIGINSMGSYDSMLFDFTCWTEKQFIAKASKRINNCK